MKYLDTREELIQLIPQNSIGAEVGIFRGEFSRILLETTKPQLFYMIDPWEGNIMSGDKNGQNIEYIEGDKYYVEHIIPEFMFQPQIKILRNYSDVLALFPDNYLDWIYLDGAHDYEYIRQDLENSLYKVKQGGLIMGHDYTNAMFPGLVYAVDQFCQTHNLEIEYLTKDGCPSYLITKK
jgi:hypothetical protein